MRKGPGVERRGERARSLREPVALGTRELARLERRCRATLEAAGQRDGIEGWGPALVEREAWLAELPPQVLARCAWQALGLPGKPVITPALAVKLAAYCRRLDRYADLGAGRRGVWVEIVLGQVAGGWREWLTGPPRTLGLIAIATKRQANTWRYHARARARLADEEEHGRAEVRKRRAQRRASRHVADEQKRAAATRRAQQRDRLLDELAGPSPRRRPRG